MVIKKQLGDVNYNELPIQKRIQIDQKIHCKESKSNSKDDYKTSQKN